MAKAILAVLFHCIGWVLSVIENRGCSDIRSGFLSQSPQWIDAPSWTLPYDRISQLLPGYESLSN
jgi:hypothetical protein